MRCADDELTLRPATDGDRPFLLRLYASTRERELAQVPFTAQQKAAFLEQQFSARGAHYATYPGLTAEVVEVGGTAAGQLLVARWPAELRIVDIALLPAFRGRGLGTRLLRPLLTEADQRRLPLTIHVERSNPAARLYARLGFAPAGPDDGAVHHLWARQPKTAS